MSEQVDLMDQIKEHNRQAYLNYGLICYGKLEDIERLQNFLVKECSGLNVVYQKVTGERLFLGTKK